MTYVWQEVITQIQVVATELLSRRIQIFLNRNQKKNGKSNSGIPGMNRKNKEDIGNSYNSIITEQINKS